MSEVDVTLDDDGVVVVRVDQERWSSAEQSLHFFSGDSPKVANLESVDLFCDEVASDGFRVNAEDVGYFLKSEHFRFF